MPSRQGSRTNLAAMPRAAGGRAGAEQITPKARVLTRQPRCAAHLRYGQYHNGSGRFVAANPPLRYSEQADYFRAFLLSIGALIGCDLSMHPNIERWLDNLRKLKSWGQINEVFDGFVAARQGVRMRVRDVRLGTLSLGHPPHPAWHRSPSPA